ncbi:MAG: hypothetical protein CVU89_06760 [Firmicutes bacterium HGW-Firmicutes-14]|nr:MAG: hypothetical protein CVU89_06760 [Firmicutes bacterium HGW-Firmicutes-14]
MFGTRGHIGLDISTNSIRAVETENKPTPVIQKIGVSRPVDGTIIDGAVAKPEELVKALREAAIDGGFKNKSVCFAVNPLNVVIRHLEMPLMNREETREALKWELSKNIPFTGSAVFDFQTTPGDNGTMNVMLAAAEEQTVAGYCDCIREAGFTLTAADIEPLALARLIGRLDRISDRDKGLRKNWDTGTVILIDLGDRFTGLSFFKEARLSFYRVIPLGGYQLPGDSELNSWVGKLVHEVERSVKFYQVQHRDDDISGIILAGGLSVLKELEDFLEKELGAVVEALNPFPVFNISPEAEAKAATHSYTLSLSLGLAVRGSGS